MEDEYQDDLPTASSAILQAMAKADMPPSSEYYFGSIPRQRELRTRPDGFRMPKKDTPQNR